MNYNEEYYAGNAQNKDRPALLYYQRLLKRYFSDGPLLEFGCGVGHFAGRISRFTQVTVLEINKYALSQIRVNAPEATIVNSLSEIAAESLDSIVSLHVMEHINDTELYVIGKEFRRILRKKGRLLIVVPDPSGTAAKLKGPDWMGYSDPTHINLKGAKEWQNYFVTRWGMKIVLTGSDGYYDFPYARTFWGRLIGDVGRLLRTGIQFISGRIFIDAGDGEAAVFILEIES